tara:strand:- start:252 stop:521 length:270 start_codon:yes stop_codon:yes gene_type:complete
MEFNFTWYEWFGLFILAFVVWDLVGTEKETTLKKERKQREWYDQVILPRLEELSSEERKKLLKELDELTSSETATKQQAIDLVTRWFKK